MDQAGMVMIIEIFVTQHRAMKPLTDQFLDAMFYITLVTVIEEAAGKIPDQAVVALQVAQDNPPPSLER